MVTKSIQVIERKKEERPIPMLVQIASQYKSSIDISKDEKTANAKSIMGMLSFGFEPGQSLTVSIDGEDEELAMTGIEEYLTGRA